jgi:hypothetical protein
MWKPRSLSLGSKTPVSRPLGKGEQELEEKLDQKELT